MTKSVKQWLFWTPRVLVILFAAFVSIFALDVFGTGDGLWETMLALLIHLIPTGLLVVVLVISWRWAWVGGVLFPGLGLVYLVSSWGRFPWSVYLIMTGPLFLVGILFWLNWLYKNEPRFTPRQFSAAMVGRQKINKNKSG